MGKSDKRSTVGLYLSHAFLRRVEWYCQRHEEQTGFSVSKSKAIEVLLGRALTAEGVPVVVPAPDEVVADD